MKAEQDFWGGRSGWREARFFFYAECRSNPEGTRDAFNFPRELSVWHPSKMCSFLVFSLSLSLSLPLQGRRLTRHQAFCSPRRRSGKGKPRLSGVSRRAKPKLGPVIEKAGRISKPKWKVNCSACSFFFFPFTPPNGEFYRTTCSHG